MNYSSLLSHKIQVADAVNKEAIRIVETSIAKIKQSHCINQFWRNSWNPNVKVFWFSGSSSEKLALSAGFATRKNDEIWLNSNFIGELGFWENTIPHELAHLATFFFYPNAKQAHGPEFRLFCNILGISTDTYHNMAGNETAQAYAAKAKSNVCYCGCGEHKVSNVIFKRINQGTRYRCKKCSKVLGLVDCS